MSMKNVQPIKIKKVGDVFEINEQQIGILPEVVFKNTNFTNNNGVYFTHNTYRLTCPSFDFEDLPIKILGNMNFMRQVSDDLEKMTLDFKQLFIFYYFCICYQLGDYSFEYARVTSFDTAKYIFLLFLFNIMNSTYYFFTSRGTFENHMYYYIIIFILSSYIEQKPENVGVFMNSTVFYFFAFISLFCFNVVQLIVPSLA